MRSQFIALFIIFVLVSTAVLAAPETDVNPLSYPEGFRGRQTIVVIIPRGACTPLIQAALASKLLYYKRIGVAVIVAMYKASYPKEVSETLEMVSDIYLGDGTGFINYLEGRLNLTINPERDIWVLYFDYYGNLRYVSPILFSGGDVWEELKAKVYEDRETILHSLEIINNLQEKVERLSNDLAFLRSMLSGSSAIANSSARRLIEMSRRLAECEKSKKNLTEIYERKISELEAENRGLRLNLSKLQEELRVARENLTATKTRYEDEISRLKLEISGIKTRDEEIFIALAIVIAALVTVIAYLYSYYKRATYTFESSVEPTPLE